MTKFTIVTLATAATFILLPFYFPGLHSRAFDNVYGITWAMVLAVVVLVAGMTKLTTK